ncbi:Acyl-CoA thioesterase FadM [Desulfomicrobium norvegicum]|uniref:Acyl-CoA thioesterase FadM n=1 Tax=Desulfomicrobium norvegicum (strain DSM 1741 / NCIMB 8310) TaxID=52561 RepID=A0A8G2FEE1_DESNO|nr:thioesterase family protein [Desulfomicrobium norvegicum]SFL73622.1 Acyl-CoA thioesterase FadM [Desulfomicrobium norvegicum]
MARVQIELPESWLFRTRLSVRVTDVNYGGHLGNDRVLGLAHEARVRWLASCGLSEKDVGGVGLIMADAALVFRGEAFLGDELDVAVGAIEVRRSSFDLVYLLTRPADAVEIALVKTGMVCFDYSLRKVSRLPQGLLRCLGSDA